MTKKDILTGALLIGLLAGLIGIAAVHGRTITPNLMHVGSTGWCMVLGMALLTAYLDTCVGGGHGTLLTPMLILLGFPSRMVVPAILLSEVGIGILATILNHRAGNIRLARGEQHRRVLLVLSICSLVGSVVAVTAAVKLPQRWVNLYIGLVIVAVGLLVVTQWRSARGFSMKRIVVLGTVAAFNKGISGGGYGPLLTAGQVLSGVCEKGAVSITPPARVDGVNRGHPVLRRPRHARTWPGVAAGSGVPAGDAGGSLYGGPSQCRCAAQRHRGGNAGPWYAARAQGIGLSPSFRSR